MRVVLTHHSQGSDSSPISCSCPSCSTTVRLRRRQGFCSSVGKPQMESYESRDSHGQKPLDRFTKLQNANLRCPPGPWWGETQGWSWCVRGGSVRSRPGKSHRAWWWRWDPGTFLRSQLYSLMQKRGEKRVSKSANLINLCSVRS